MIDKQIIKACAELDGKTKLLNADTGCAVMYWEDGHDWRMLPKYLTSYDAIIPLIQKQSGETKVSMQMWMLDRNTGNFDVSPRQLCEALLHATGRWVE